MPVQILMVGNGTNYNRGCEAIARGTFALFSAAGRSVELISAVLVSDAEQEKAVAEHVAGPGEPAQVPLHVRTSRNAIDRIKARFPGGRPKYFGEEIDGYVENADLVLQVGGDNYSLDYGPPWAFIDLDNQIKANGVPVYIWGASVGPFSAMPRVQTLMTRHLNSIDGVLVRESVSYNDLISMGVENVHQMIDPAFFMPPQIPDNPGFDADQFHGAVGLNLSPFQATHLSGSHHNYWETTEVELENLADFGAELVDEVLATSDAPLVLLPHVFGPHTWNDDYRLLSTVRRKLDARNLERVAIPSPNLSAPELKWIASNCSVFAGSRTHATLAAVSTGVPTLAFGYSRKAQGLMRDLYDADDYVIPPAEFTIDNVISSLSKLISQESKLRHHLDERLAAIRKMGLSAVAVTTAP